MDFSNLDSDDGIIVDLFTRIDESLEYLNQLNIQITEIPAPPFREEQRAEYIAENLHSIGYEVKTDEIGNILATKSFKNLDTMVIVSAHLDTVFSNDIIKVHKDGDILKAPGIGDDSRGLANLLLLAELLFDIETKIPLMFVTTVGEEGLGDLRGVKHLFSSPAFTPQTVRAFITIDGTGISRVVDQGVGSVRYQIDFKGPGGHSYGAFGMVNPAFAAGYFLEQLAQYQVPSNPKTTYSVGTFAGGTSINSIPEKISLGIDLRSESQEYLTSLATSVKQFAKNSAQIENSRREGEIDLEIKEVGNRPAGRLSDHHWLREVIQATHEMMDISVDYGASSTDANVPLDLGIPAISIGGVIEAGRAHSQDEWVKADKQSLLIVKRNLLLVYLVSQR